MDKTIHFSLVAKRTSFVSPALHHLHRGMTLVELLVGLVIGLLVTLAAVSSLIVTRQGFTTVDTASQLRDNGRFVADLIQRIAFQTGFKDINYVLASGTDNTIAANVTGFNNARLTGLTNSPASASATSSGVVNSSDILILRYQTAQLNYGSGSNAADKSMIDCDGNPVNTISSGPDDRMVSAFYVQLGTIDREPSLMCGTVSSNGNLYSQPIIRGVENFQVLYGVSGTSLNTTHNKFNCDSAHLPASPAPNSPDDPYYSQRIPSIYLRADQMTVGTDANSADTYDNWRCVRSIRIGMVLRGPPNSQQESTSQTFYPFGLAASSANGTAGSALSSSSDLGAIFKPAPDSRMRLVVTFTIHLRNDQRL